VGTGNHTTTFDSLAYDTEYGTFTTTSWPTLPPWAVALIKNPTCGVQVACTFVTLGAIGEAADLAIITPTRIHGVAVVNPAPARSRVPAEDRVNPAALPVNPNGTPEQSKTCTLTSAGSDQVPVTVTEPHEENDAGRISEEEKNPGPSSVNDAAPEAILTSPDWLSTPNGSVNVNVYDPSASAIV